MFGRRLAVFGRGGCGIAKEEFRRINPLTAVFSVSKGGKQHIFTGLSSTVEMYNFKRVLYSPLLNLPSLRFYCVGGC
jgi:hypothetical protein